MQNVEKDLKDNYSDIKKDVGHLVDDAKKGFSNVKNKSKEAISDVQDQAKEYAAHVSHNLSQSVKQNPLLAVGVAALSGAVLALLLCR